ncbi:tetratricopeptide repeat protein [Streptomyces sp. NPDC020883]|uniref:tetratricopeptide repeat protein n=1 Tax=Streptomyces sp. NPDC020883 TaxID=3365099 RepID=UPI00378D9321
MAVNRIGTETSLFLRYDDSAVSHWLSGTMPRKSVRPIILEAFSRRLGRPVTAAEAGFTTDADPMKGQTTDTVASLIELARWDVDPSRRSVLGAALFSVALTIPAWPDVLGRSEALAAGKMSRIGYGDVDMVIQMTEKISELDDLFGGRHARPMAASFLVNTVATYLKADGPEDVCKAMHSAASDLCYLTGYMAVDEGLHGLAQHYYLKALELAGAADDHLTYCTTLRGMSVQAVELGHSQHSLRLADAAAAASPKAGPRMLAFLTGQQAHAAAQNGDRSNALAKIKEAERAIDIAESREKAFGSYDPSSLHYHVSQVRYELGDITGSIASMQESDKLRHSVYRRSRVYHLGMLAERQLKIGHLEAACTTWHTALDDYQLVQSGRCDTRFQVMQKSLRPYLKNRHAHELNERFTQIGKEPT